MTNVITLARREVTHDSQKTKNGPDSIVRSQRLTGRWVIGKTKITQSLCDKTELKPPIRNQDYDFILSSCHARIYQLLAGGCHRIYFSLL